MNFYPRSPCGERRHQTYQLNEKQAFLSTLSLRRATRGKVTNEYDRSDFYPRSPCGERPASASKRAVNALFLSTLSLRRATRATLYELDGYTISIHALLAESDLIDAVSQHSYNLFLSTLSLRRATRQSVHCSAALIYFYPRSPCGERRESQPPSERPTKDFYPRSPCGERQFSRRLIHHLSKFLSTLSLRRATNGRISDAVNLTISIHALLAESDKARPNCQSK